MGGSALQWHPDLEIGFGYAMNYVFFPDLVNTKAARLQRAVVECAEKLGKK